MSQQQRAVVVREVGKPVELITRAIPTPMEDEVLVKVTAVMLLPHDAYGRDWGLLIDKALPFVLGQNISGIIQKVGTSVRGFGPGDRIFGMGNIALADPNQSGLQEYALLSESLIAQIPEGFSDDQVASLPVNLVTSFVTLFTKTYGFNWPAPWKQDQNFNARDQTIVIIGAGAVTAKWGVQFAKLAGIGRIIAIAGINNEEELKRMGATHVVDRHGSMDEVAAKVHAITGVDGVTHVYDCRSMTFELAISLLSKAKPSRLITLHPNEQLEEIKQKRPLCSANFVEDIHAGLGADAEKFWENVPVWLKDGSVLPGPYRVVEGLERLDEINAGLDGYMSGAAGPQMIVHP